MSRSKVKRWMTFAILFIAGVVLSTVVIRQFPILEKLKEMAKV